MSSTRQSQVKPVRVLKFGGSSVADAPSIRRVVDVIRDTARSNRVVVVVSALASVTNTLDALLSNPETDRTAKLLNLYRQHLSTARELLTAPEAERYQHILTERLSSIIPSLRRVNQHLHSRFDSERILAAGERFSVPLIAASLRSNGLESRAVDAAALIRVENVRDPGVDLEKTNAQINGWYQTLQTDEIPVVTGFIAGAPCGRTVTLGRGGSDFTASLIASALRADLLERWTDVDGLYSEDPNADGNPTKYEVLRMEDAEMLNSANRLGMHEHAITPLLATRTPLRVRSLRSNGSGTLILPGSDSSDPQASAA